MSGRGKGGKGLGKGGAKRHRKILRDNIQVSNVSALASSVFATSVLTLAPPLRSLHLRVSPSPPSAAWHAVEE